ncbi:glycoside hydrolase family 19 protein [Sphingobium yanoikuyae]|uniref:glycoside hydrolase family 19 protein n=1 Tax=Sphingobium yanoikuyae TaxID=13690 RepID=UPI00242F62F2|nr:glycoside hydrolase family 19 protein [Sphingobium yanoikuyae]
MDKKTVQSRLQAAGHYSGRIDGDFGRLSYGALFSYTGGAASDLTRHLGEAAAALFPRYDMVTGLRLAHALARWAVETGGFKRMEENLKYSAARLRQVWPSRFPTLASAQPFAGNPKALANHVYGGRFGNDNANDGWRHRGRGPTQLTFEDNYREAKALTGVDVLADPDLVAQPATGLLVACAYWGARKISAAADRDDAATVCKLVQGASEGLAEQRAYLARLKKVLL